MPYNSPYLDAPLRSPEEVMESLRIKHPEMLTQIHALLERAETLARKISDEHPGCSAVDRSFGDLADRLSDLRADYLAPADHDLKEWQRSRGEL